MGSSTTVESTSRDRPDRGLGSPSGSRAARRCATTRSLRCGRSMPRVMSRVRTAVSVSVHVNRPLVPIPVLPVLQPDVGVSRDRAGSRPQHRGADLGSRERIATEDSEDPTPRPAAAARRPRITRVSRSSTAEIPAGCGKGPGAACAAPDGRSDHRPLPTGTVLEALEAFEAVFFEAAEEERRAPEPVDRTFRSASSDRRAPRTA